MLLAGGTWIVVSLTSVFAAGDVASRYGYLGVAVMVFVEGFGVPAPGETAIIFAAASAATGHLNIAMVAVIGFLAAVAGDSVGYLIGRTAGRRVVLRYGRWVRLSEARLSRLETFMTRHGPKVVLLARFVEGLRQLNGVVAGLSGMPWRRFVTFNAIGAALWVGSWAALAYVAGDHLTGLEHAVRRYHWIGWIVAASLVVAITARYLWRARQAR